MPVYVFMDKVEYDTSAPVSDAKTFRRLQVLGNQISEHLGCFVVYGFDHHGTPVKIGNVSSPMEDMAISKLIEEDVMSTLPPFELPESPEKGDEEDF